MNLYNPIQDELCEQVVIGTLVAVSREWQENADLLCDGLFYNSRYAGLYKAAVKIRERGDTADVAAVYAELMKDQRNIETHDLWMQALIDCTARVATNGIRQHVLHLLDYMRRRRVMRICLKGLQDVQDRSTAVETVQEAAIDDLGKLFDTAVSDVMSTKRVADDFTRDVIDANRKGDRPCGIPTGFTVLDEKGGLQLADLVVIAADSSQGKTAFMLGIAKNAALNGYPAAIYSMEMTAGQLFARLAAMEMGVPSNILNTKALTDDQYQRYLAAKEKLSPVMMFFDEKSTSSLDAIISSVRTLVYKSGVKLVAVDYLQILNVAMAYVNKEQAMANAARRLKNLAKELGICIIALSQLARDRENPEPTMARLRDSGQIAEAADMVILIYRPETYGKLYSGDFKNTQTKGTALINLAKGRNTGTAKFIVNFDAPLTKFYEAAGTQSYTTAYADETPF